MWEEEDEGGVVLAEAEPADKPMATMGMAEMPEGGTIAMMVQAAQSLDRSENRLTARAKQIGELMGADAFYRFPAGGEVVEGESIGLAEALAQEWGGILYKVHILRSEPLASGGRRVHQRASCIDLKSLVCAEVDQIVSTSPPPGKFGKKPDQAERWHSMQANSAASKIVRNGILRVLPKWFRRAAFNAARKIADGHVLGKNEDGSPRTLAQARGAAIEKLEGLGCKLEELEQYIGQPVGMWAVPQLAQLRELFRQMRTGTISVEAWRDSLGEHAATAGNGVTRSALGLPAQTNGGEAVTDQMPADRAAEPAKAKGKKGKGEQETLPGAEK